MARKGTKLYENTTIAYSTHTFIESCCKMFMASTQMLVFDKVPSSASRRVLQLTSGLRWHAEALLNDLYYVAGTAPVANHLSQGTFRP